MKNVRPPARRATAKRARPKTPPQGAGRIHPVVVYPFQHPTDLVHVQELYRLVGQLAEAPETYARPITVMDRKTHHAMRQNRDFCRFREQVVAASSDLLEAWCVDTCQMWYCGLGAAFERGTDGDVYWLIPGDFNYGSPVGREVIGRLHDLPEICAELGQDLCIGEIATDHNNPKQLIDTYGTFALLYNWFPAEAQEIREYTERPRSEFFALRHEFLAELLHQRWFAYEQTVVALLHAIAGRKHISRFFVGQISDLPEGREGFSSAMQQVERTERVLKTLWRERHDQRPGWQDDYRRLEARSEQVRRAALGVLENLLP
ncbi:MAG: hypothetical protein H7A45_10880 [Verrucomicrobiales bacterium]|nr:hypothetical protein [Verrucomicrobiales bacterium]MCP5526837.1 hypothetical protein [Verrucomicrobiales bacterium]